jgi:hypothetical protein
MISPEQLTHGRAIIARLAARTNLIGVGADTGPYDEHYFEALSADEEEAPQ